MQKKILIIVIVTIVLLGAGVLIGTEIPRKVATTNGNQPDTFQAGWDAARARLSQSPLGASTPAGMEIKSVSGTIQKINGNTLTVKINPLEPLADPSLDTRTITVTSSTKITLNVSKDPVQFQKEIQDYQAQMQQQSAQGVPVAPQAGVLPPMPYNQKDIKISDLKVNQTIVITANEDIKNKPAFTATQIDAQEIITATTPGAAAPTAPVPVVAP